MKVSRPVIYLNSLVKFMNHNLTRADVAQNDQTGEWEVSLFELPYPPTASKLAITLYEQLRLLIVDAQIKQLEGRILTMLDSWGDDERTNKARKDITREIISKVRSNTEAEIIYTVGHLDKWLKWFKQSSDKDAVKTSRASEDYNPFNDISNLD